MLKARNLTFIRIDLYYSRIRKGLCYSSIRKGLCYSSICIGLHYSGIPISFHYCNISVRQEIFAMPQLQIQIFKLSVFSSDPLPIAEPIRCRSKFKLISSLRFTPCHYQSYDYNSINSTICLRHTTHTECSRVTSADKFKMF
jgi:hypothetical protein